MYTQSISTSAQSGLRAATDTVRVLGQFRRAVDVLIGDDVITPVTPEVGNGLYNIVIAALPDAPLPQHVACARTANDAAAAPHTPQRAFLHATSEGLADEHWHTLHAALRTENHMQLECAATNVLDCGASSGLDIEALRQG